VARALGLRRERELAGEFALLFAYWTGLPPSEWFRTDVRQDSSLTCCPCEDGIVRHEAPSDRAGWKDPPAVCRSRPLKLRAA
jgi:hypothetical protein